MRVCQQLVYAHIFTVQHNLTLKGHSAYDLFRKTWLIYINSMHIKSLHLAANTNAYILVSVRGIMQILKKKNQLFSSTLRTLNSFGTKKKSGDALKGSFFEVFLVSVSLMLLSYKDMMDKTYRPEATSSHLYKRNASGSWM